MITKKRNKNAIILGFIVALLIFVVSILFGYFYTYRQIVQIREDKNTFSNLLKSYNNLKVKGLGYGDYKQLVTKKSFDDPKLTELMSDNYTRNLLVKVDKKFYNSSFINKTKKDYTDFLESKKQENKDSKALDAFREKESKISSVLPVYITENEFYTEDGLTDFKFINYVENLLRKYKLKTTSAIGITQFNLVEDTLNKVKNTEKNLSETGIYYIPLKLDLVGTKGNIIRFLEEVYSMGSVVEKDGDIDIQNDKHIVENYSIDMKDYIDSSTINNDTKLLLDLISGSEQSKEKFSITTELRFYVVGIPKYRLKQEIEKILSNNTESEKYNYYNLLSRVEVFLKKDNNIFNSAKIEEINKYLLEIKEDVKIVLKNTGTGKDLEKQLKKALNYRDIFMGLDKKLNNISNKLNLK